jgi:hypothetical protein
VHPDCNPTQIDVIFETSTIFIVATPNLQLDALQLDALPWHLFPNAAGGSPGDNAGCDELVTIHQDAESQRALRRFLSYSAVVAGTLPTDKGNVRNSIPLTYAALAGLNRLILTHLQDAAEARPTDIRISRASFRKQLTGRRQWLGDVSQFNRTLNKLQGCGDLDDGKDIGIKQALVDRLVAHAQGIYSFMTEQAANLELVPLRDWLVLNDNVFTKFFFREFGDAWRELRAEVNQMLRKGNGGPRRGRNRSRSHNVDYLDRYPTLWLAFNIVAVEGPGTIYQISHRIDGHGLSRIWPRMGEVADAVSQLVVSGVLTDEGNIFDVASRLHSLTAKYKAEIVNGLAVIEVDCRALMTRIDDYTTTPGGTGYIRGTT